MRLEDGRSAKFPLSVPLHNLRFVLGAGDVEALAERAAGSLQDWIGRVPAAAHYRPAAPGGVGSSGGGCNSRYCLRCGVGSSARRGGPGAGAGAGAGVIDNQAGEEVGAGGGRASGGAVDGRLRCEERGGGGLPLSAALMLCRADRGFVRLGLRPPVAVARVLAAAAVATEPPPAWLPAVAAEVSVAGLVHGTGADTAPWVAAGGEKGSVTAAAAAAVAAEEAAAAVAAGEEVAQLRLLELALAGVPFAREAWRAFAAGCQRVAVSRLTAPATGAVGPAAAPAGRVQPQAPPPVALEAEGGSGGAVDGGGKHTQHAQHMHAHRHSICGLLPLPCTTTVDRISWPSATGGSFPPGAAAGGEGSCRDRLHATCSTLRLRLVALMTRGWGPAPGTAAAESVTAAQAGPELLAGVAVAGERGGAQQVAGAALAAAAVAPPSSQPPAAALRMELESALNSACNVAVAYGKLQAAVGAVQAGWHREMADRGYVSLGHQNDNSDGCSDGIGGSSGGNGLGPMSNAAVGAVRHCVSDAAVAATGTDALMCLTTFEALLEVRAAVAAVAAAAATAAAAAAAAAVGQPGRATAPKAQRGSAAPLPRNGLHNSTSSGANTVPAYGAAWSAGGQSHSISSNPKWDVALSPQPAIASLRAASDSTEASASLRPPLAALSSRPSPPSGGTADRSSGRGTSGCTTAAAAECDSSEAPLCWAPEAPTVSSVIRDLCGLLSGTLAPAVARLLEPPRPSYSPLGLLVGGGGDGGGGFGGAEAAGRSLARVAVVGVDGVDGREQREALRALLIVYLRSCMTWALVAMGAL